MHPADNPPPVTSNADVPVSARIIVKYVDAEGKRLANEAAALDAARVLSEIAGTELRHLRLMSGNAHVVEIENLEGLQGSQAQEQIESIIRRIEADPAVDFAEPDAIMQIQ